MSESKWSDRPETMPQQRASAWPWMVVFVLGLLVAYMLMLFGLPRRQPATTIHPAVGTRVQFVELEPLTAEGPPVALADLQGKVTLINFWGPWCGPCAVEFPHLVEMEQHFRQHPDFRLLAVAYPNGPEDAPRLRAESAFFLAQQQASFPAYRDPTLATLGHLEHVAKLDGFVFPTTVVLSRDGTIRGLWTGYMPGDERQVQQVVEAELAAPPQSPQNPPSNTPQPEDH